MRGQQCSHIYTYPPSTPVQLAHFTRPAHLSLPHTWRWHATPWWPWRWTSSSPRRTRWCWSCWSVAGSEAWLDSAHRLKTTAQYTLQPARIRDVLVFRLFTVLSHSFVLENPFRPFTTKWHSWRSSECFIIEILLESFSDIPFNFKQWIFRLMHLKLGYLETCQTAFSIFPPKKVNLHRAKSAFFLWPLSITGIFCEPIWKRCRFRFLSNKTLIM